MKRIPKIFRLLIFASLLVAFSFFLISKQISSSVISPLANSSEENPIYRFLFGKTVDTPEKLTSEIKEFLKDQDGIYSVYIYDINNNVGFGFNETTIFTAASIIKIPILASLYYKAQSQKIDLDQKITIQANDIQDYGTGIIRNEGPGGVYSIKSLAQVMMEKSDNTAAFVLTNILGDIHLLINDWELIQTSIANNKTSNKDMARLMIKMFKGQVTNQAFTQEMLGFMDDSDFENRLPKLLPKNIKVFHKIGNDIGNVHDVGIINLENRPYYIGVMTNDVIDEPIIEENIAKISKMVFEFMNRE